MPNKNILPKNSQDYIKQEVHGSDLIAKVIEQKYRRKFSAKYMYERQNRFILDFLKTQKVGKLLELGCGIGNFLVQAQSQFPIILGMDPGPGSLKMAKELGIKTSLCLGRGENLPFNDQSIDAVVMKGVVHHLEEPTVIFREVHRCLKPKGILVIFEGNRSSLYRKIVLGIADLFRYNHETTLYEHRAPGLMRKMLMDSSLTPFYCRNISGFFAPLALAGIGGQKVWKLLGKVEDTFQTICPSLFNCYVFIAARKSE